jgi:pimeloyl-ACP methyl ester carboxylesterase
LIVARRAASIGTAIGLVLALTPTAVAAPNEVAQPPGPPPQLLLIHGGSFLFEDPFFEARTKPVAVAAGFVPHYLAYPLGDLPAAVTAAREEAARLRAKFGRAVYAYGSSAGGTLAALLAGDGLVSAAVAKAPPTDFLSWEWPLSAYGPGYYTEIDASVATRRRLSPIRRPMRQPVLVVQGRADAVVPLRMSEAFAVKFPRVQLWKVPGGHGTDRARPWVTRRALGWLAKMADRGIGRGSAR